MGTPTTPALLSYDRALELLRALVAEFGEDFVYTPAGPLVTCLYVHGDQPGCGVGHVLHRAGVPLDVLRDVDDSMCSAASEAPQFRDYADYDALQLLVDFQDAQDAGETWGVSLRRAVGGGSDE